MAKELWVEKYRPKTLGVEGFVFTDESQKAHINKILTTKELPMLILSGGPGSGKTTLARILINDLGIDPLDVLDLNGSKENSVDIMRDKIYRFASAMPFGELNLRVVFFDEFDFATIQAQSVLRNLTETYSSTCRFILTCNYVQKIIPALRSRFTEIHFNSLDEMGFQIRLGEVLVNEGIQFDMDTLDSYVKAAFPDLRKGINLLQQYSTDGVLQVPEKKNSASTQDYMLKAVQLFKEKKITEARKYILDNIKDDEYEDMYRFFYRNLEFWGTTDHEQNQAIVIIARGLRDHTISIDAEINLSSCLVQLMTIR
jgi:DNA polymerase III delta prime subunit